MLSLYEKVYATSYYHLGANLFNMLMMYNIKANLISEIGVDGDVVDIPEHSLQKDLLDADQKIVVRVQHVTWKLKYDSQLR